MNILACKKCRNIFADRIGGVKSIPAKCPVCGEASTQNISN